MLKKLIVSIILTLVLMGVANAGASDNVSGFAWSENVGWISFNNTSGGGSINYGVNIDSDGTFSGYAWSENIGWIHFAPFGPYLDSPNYSAKMDIANGQVSGWARALSYGGGWDGWIKMRGTNYGVAVNTANGQFSGYAWSDMVIGWVDFSRVQTSLSFNAAPTAVNLSADNPNQTDYCGITGYPAVRVRWQFQDPGDAQSAYQVKVTGPGQTIDTGKVSGSSQSYVFQEAGKQLSWGANYTWQIRVWDSQDKPSAGWISGPSFSTISHAYPLVNFSWAPLSPNTGELIQFADQTVYAGSSAGQSWTWNFGDSQTSSTQNPTHSYSSPGTYQVRLGVCDSSGQCCNGANGRQNTVQTLAPLPEWQEISPF